MLSFFKPDWSAPPNIVALSTQISGGVSQGEYKGLNLAMHVGDDAASVTRNREMLEQFLNKQYGDIAPITWLNQTHSSNAIYLRAKHQAHLAQSDTHNNLLNADAALCAEVGLPCTVMTADCLPVFICDKQATTVAMIHAGWRGLAKGILQATLTQMNVPPSQLCAAFGPAICHACYQVKRSDMQMFAHIDGALRADNAQGKAKLDLKAIAKHQLHMAGVHDISCESPCTYCSSEYYSHRRATHQNQTNTGRIANLILIKPSSN